MTNDKVKTGLIEFEDDWVSLLIRGEDAIDYGIVLDSLIKDMDEPPVALQDLKILLMQCESGSFSGSTKLMSFDKCRRRSNGFSIFGRRFGDKEVPSKTPPPKYNVGQDLVTTEQRACTVTDRRMSKSDWEYRMVMHDTAEHEDHFEGALSIPKDT